MDDVTGRPGFFGKNHKNKKTEWLIRKMRAPFISLSRWKCQWDHVPLTRVKAFFGSPGIGQRMMRSAHPTWARYIAIPIHGGGERVMLSVSVRHVRILEANTMVLGKTALSVV